MHHSKFYPRFLVGLLLSTSALLAAPVTNDNFSRNVTAGWGSTPQAQTYIISEGNRSDFNVSDTRAQVKLGSDASRLVSLPLRLENTEGTVSLALTTVPTASYTHAGVITRIQSSNTDGYYFCLKHTIGGATLSIQKIINGTPTTLSPEFTLGTHCDTSTRYHLRFSTAGVSPTHLRAKVWTNDEPEPALWHVAINDATPSLQASGGVGIRAGATPGFAPLGRSYLFDNLHVYDVAFVPNLKTAMQNAVAGDILYFTGIHEGTVHTNANGTAEAPIIVRGIDATIQTPSLTDAFGVYARNDYWWFDNFTINHAQKGFYSLNAHHGRLTHINVSHIGQEAFKFRRYSSYWDVVSCSASDTGINLGEYGEGFYCGDAKQNWEVNSSGQHVPDNTGYITFIDCRTTDTRNDGFDLKEGSHHIKFLRCVADFSGPIEPKNNTRTGGSGFAFRGTAHVQVIDCKVNDLGSGEAAYKLYGTTVNDVTYGSDVEYKHVTAINITNPPGQTSASMFLLAHIDSSAVTIYTDYTETNTATFGPKKAEYTSKTPANFVELTW